MELLFKQALGSAEESNILMQILIPHNMFSLQNLPADIPDANSVPTSQVRFIGKELNS